MTIACSHKEEVLLFLRPESELKFLGDEAARAATQPDTKCT